MTDQLTDNEVIARFMRYSNPHDPNFILVKYSTSWDWLMPVVEKISRHVYDEQPDADGFGGTIKYTAYPRTFGMLSPEGKIMVRFNNSTLFEADTLIEATYQAVVDWIQWYNSINQTVKK